MKRRTFLQVFAGLFAAPAVPPVVEKLTSFSVPITIDQMRSPGVVAAMAPAQEAANVWQTSMLRELHKEELSKWLAREFDRQVVESLTGKNFRA